MPHVATQGCGQDAERPLVWPPASTILLIAPAFNVLREGDPFAAGSSRLMAEMTPAEREELMARP